MRLEDKERLERYVNAAIVPRYNTDRRKYPIYAGRLGKLYLDILSGELFCDIDEFINKGGTIKDLAIIFNNPTRIMRMAHTILAGMKMRNCPIEKQQQMILTLLDIVKAMKYGSEFCDDGRNIILSPSRLSDILEREPLVKSDKESSRPIQQLCGVLWGYAETPYFVCHGIAMEAHGPYRNPRVESQIVLIRDFCNLKPIDLWEECGRALYERVRVVTVHENTDVWFDAFDNLYVRRGNLAETLSSYHVKADGGYLDLDKIKELSDNLNSIVFSITAKANSWTEREIAAKYMDIFWYQIKPLKDALGKSWRPPSVVFDRVRTTEIPPHSDKRPTVEGLKQEMLLT